MDTRRLRSVAMIAVFDIAGPLVAYSLLRSAGFAAVSALVLSGVFPAAAVIIGIISHRRVDALGILVLAGIVAGAILGLVSHNARLVLDEGSVPTAVLGLICLGSLATPRPLMYRLALEFTGPDTPKGREFASLLRYEEFRHPFRVLTVVWGVTYLAEAAARVVIVANTSAGTALAISKVLPYAVAAVLTAWSVGYGRRQKRRGERLAAAGAAAAATEAASDRHPPDQPAPEPTAPESPAPEAAVPETPAPEAAVPETAAAETAAAETALAETEPAEYPRPERPSAS